MNDRKDTSTPADGTHRTRRLRLAITAPMGFCPGQLFGISLKNQ